MGTPIHRHTRSHLYTLVLTYFSQIKLALRVLNFYSDVTSLKEGKGALPLQKKKIEKKEKTKTKM